MNEELAEDGCPSFTATIHFDAAQTGKPFRWGVVVDGPAGANRWGVPTEVQDKNSTERVRRRRFTVDDFSPEDLHGERIGAGAAMFRFYQEVIAFSRRRPAARSRHIDVICAWDPTRVVAFTRRSGQDELLVIASLNNAPFLDGYSIVQPDTSRLPGGLWREQFNSDAAIYGGNNVGNFGAAVPASGGQIRVRLPANGFLIFQKQ